MKFDRFYFRRAAAAVAVFLPFALLLRLLVYWKEVDADSGFFIAGNLFCTLYNVLALALFLLLLILPLFLRKREEGKARQSQQEAELAEEKEPEEDAVEEEQEEEALEKPLFPPEEDDFLIMDEPSFSSRHSHEEEEEEEEQEERSSSGGSSLSQNALIFGASTWQGFLTAVASLLPAFALIIYTFFLFLERSGAFTFLDLIYLSLSAICGIFFFVAAFWEPVGRKSARPFGFLLPAVWCCLRLVLEYQDIARFVNKSLYVGQFLFVISCLVFFLQQGQLLLEEKALFAPQSYAFSALSPVLLGFSARLPHLAAAAMNRVPIDSVDGAALLVDLALTVYVLAKLKALAEKN